ncbi:BTAD domain-containing putative transcriptional regulator [Streptomonospora nanhaiensis]|uniref:BTAD domain-containing putative transcriptional regulator n=1 Tax=Streptomonospora nanhaiensis TaxID=1323731 RepID=A0ABY6YVT9_9ACTN|nr:BTAD domain-containing putative transcriptional regulator [Streptomonospora nanhaiensis]WAE76405.1 BTAD domain-containing putative transcriptional regulator [Streptomonospora nanhaiensis]
MTGEHEDTAVELRVLGPLEARRAQGPLPLPGPRHRAVLARLILARGRTVPVDLLVEDLWEHPREGSVSAVRTFVSALRRSLEPDRAPRRPAHLLVTAPPGYALRTGPEGVDAWRFEAALTRTGTHLDTGEPGPALAELDRALALWRGPAYAEFTAYPWAHQEADRLEGLRLLAVEQRARALLDLGRAEQAAADLHPHAAAHPLRENAWNLLALALYRCGRQGEALHALRRARRTLADELGVDPGPDLRRLEADILSHAPRLTPPTPTPTPAAPDLPDRPLPADHPFVGRAHELDLLEQAAATATAHARTTPVLVSGDAGAGKSALARELTRRLAHRGWRTAWGRSPEHDGAPPTWPWTQITTALTGTDTDTPHPGPTSGDPAAARFHTLRSTTDLLTRTTGQGPLLLVLEDLHRAAQETLELLTALVAEHIPGPLLIVGTHRTGEISAPLAAALARLAPHEPVRVYLGGLPQDTTGELLRTVLDHDVDAPTLRTIHRRSGGNPFFARELARLLRTDGPSALATVPAGVRDVIRHRLAALPPPAQRLLHQAAVIGHDIDPDVLAVLAPDQDTHLDALDAALDAGFLTQQDTPLRFSHVLVRDTLYDSLSHPRRARWHTAAAEAIAALHPDRPGADAALAHHYARAHTPATAALAAHHARAAALQAEHRFAPHEAARLWQDALTAHDRSGEEDPRARLDALTGLVRALALTGRLESARHHRGRAVAEADRLGDPDLSARVITAFDVPALWPRNDDPGLSAHLVRATERTLAALPRDREALRARLLAAQALEMRGTLDGRGARAARLAEQSARRLDEPALLALALNARFMQSFSRTGQAPQRLRIGAELVALATEHSLVTFEVLGHLILVQAHAALADLAAADTHMRAADRLGALHEIPLVGVFTHWYAALRLAVTGTAREAEAAYRTASVRLAGGGMPGMEEGLLDLALVCLHLQHGHPPPTTDAPGPHAPWIRALTDPDRPPLPPRPPPGLLTEALACLGARAAVERGDRAAMERAHSLLLPAAGELAGAGSGLLTLGPVAHQLGDLALALGDPGRAAGHYRRALETAERAGAPHWASAARRAADALG